MKIYDREVLTDCTITYDIILDKTYTVSAFAEEFARLRKDDRGMIYCETENGSAIVFVFENGKVTGIRGDSTLKNAIVTNASANGGYGQMSCKAKIQNSMPKSVIKTKKFSGIEVDANDFRQWLKQSLHVCRVSFVETYDNEWEAHCYLENDKLKNILTEKHMTEEIEKHLAQRFDASLFMNMEDEFGYILLVKYKR